MIFWIILFILVVAASLILAFQSLKESSPINPIYHPQNYGVFLIRQKPQLTEQFLQYLYNICSFGEVVSIEKLFKGSESALIMHVSKSTVSRLANLIDLLELEDFTNIDQSQIAVYTGQNLVAPILEKDEQFWVQVLLKKSSPEKTSRAQSYQIALNKMIAKNIHIEGGSGFSVLTRAVVAVADAGKREIKNATLVSFEDYKRRVFNQEGQTLTKTQILNLIS